MYLPLGGWILCKCSTHVAKCMCVLSWENKEKWVGEICTVFVGLMRHILQMVFVHSLVCKAQYEEIAALVKKEHIGWESIITCCPFDKPRQSNLISLHPGSRMIAKSCVSSCWVISWTVLTPRAETHSFLYSGEKEATFWWWLNYYINIFIMTHMFRVTKKGSH